MGRVTVDTMRINDDFPAPFGPNSPTIPGPSRIVMPSTARLPPLWTLVTSTSSSTLSALTP